VVRAWRGICLCWMDKLFLRYILILSSHMLFDLQSDLLRAPSTSFSLIRAVFFSLSNFCFSCPQFSVPTDFHFLAFRFIYEYIQGDQKVSVHLTITVQKHAIIQYFKQNAFGIWNMLYWTVFQNTVRRVNKCLETGGGHCEHYLYVFLCCSMYCLFCVVFCIVCVCICVLYYRHRIATQLQLNISIIYIIPYHISYHIISYHVMPYQSYIISYHISYHISYLSCHISYHITSYHVISYRIMSCHINHISYISYHI
jgi:hypothetical protein